MSVRIFVMMNDGYSTGDGGIKLLTPALLMRISSRDSLAMNESAASLTLWRSCRSIFSG